jgi:environmental stress-induced protein Ves
MHRFSLHTLPGQPWKNGGGITREIAVIPSDAPPEGFTWRVSVAEIAQAGPFSVFPGIDRKILLLAGAGVRLQGAGIDHRLDEPLVPFAFAGEAAVVATLLGGPSQDLNVMTRRGVVRSDVQVARSGLDVAACDGLVLLAVRGTWEGTRPAPMSLAAGEGVVMPEGTAGLRMEASAPDGALAVLRILAL